MCRHFQELGLADTSKIEEEGVDGEALSGMTNEDFKELNVPMGVRIKHKKWLSGTLRSQSLSRDSASSQVPSMSAMLEDSIARPALPGAGPRESAGGGLSGSDDDLASMPEEVRGAYAKAMKGDVSAQCYLGVYYKKGQGVKQDYSRAVEWYEKAASQGHVGAQSNLGVCYDNGQGVEQDYSRAVEWYEKAASQGHVGAQSNLGVCYKNGQGVKQDYSRAVEWWEKAASQGHESAISTLELIR